MPNRYHISPKTGNPNICRAKTVENCPFGNDSEHYDSKQDARDAYERTMEELSKKQVLREREEREKARQQRMADAEKNWPTPSSERTKQYTSNGYEVETQHKALYLTDYPINPSHHISITIMAGTTDALYMENGHALNSPMTFRSPASNEVKIGFNDYATRMTEDEAKEHLEELKTTLNASNGFISKINETIKNAEELYGYPKKRTHDNHYKKVQSVDDTLHNNTVVLPVKEDELSWNDERSFTYIGDSFNLYFTKHKNGDFSTEINMSSMSRSTDVNDFKNRIYELRNVLATVDDLKNRL